MIGETDLNTLLHSMQAHLHAGDFVFVTVEDVDKIDRKLTVCEFKEEEGFTLVLKREDADRLKLDYHFIAAWITLKVHSSLEAVGLTAAFSQALAAENISCNVIAGYYHDHIFVGKDDAKKAMRVLTELSQKH